MTAILVTIYTMKQCPYCVSATSLLNKRGIVFESVVVDPDDDQMWEDLYKRSGMKTVPQIFHGKKLIGGFRELDALDKVDSLASLKKAP
jgi:glutaredoxin 3